jgi:hypothetical protein
MWLVVALTPIRRFAVGACDGLRRCNRCAKTPTHSTYCAYSPQREFLKSIAAGAPARLYQRRRRKLQAYLFVAVLGASSYTYAEATAGEQLARCIGNSRRMRIVRLCLNLEGPEPGLRENQQRAFSGTAEDQTINVHLKAGAWRINQRRGSFRVSADAGV